MDRIRKLLNTKALLLLLSFAKPFWYVILLILFFNASASAISVSTAIVSRQMIDSAVAGFFSKSIRFLVLFAVLLLLQIVLNSINSILITRYFEKMVNKTQRELILKMYSSQWFDLNRYHSGDILTRLTSDVSNIVAFWISTIPGIVALVTQLLFAFVTLLYFDKTLALCAFIIGPVTAVLSFIFGRRLKKLQREIQTAESKNRSYIQESIEKILILKTFQYEEESLKHITSNQNDKLNFVRKKSNMGAAVNLMLSGGFGLGYILAFLWGVFRLSSGTSSFGTFTAFIQLVGQIQSPFNGLAGTVPQIATTMASIERVMEFAAMETEEKEFLISDYNIAKLVADKVSFGYMKDKPILSKVFFEIKNGETAALIGPSGEGKTTVIRLLLALIRPAEGKIYIKYEDKHRTEVSSETRSLFAYVPQGNTLFSGTILENLRVGNINATYENIKQALKSACAWDFVQSLPEKENTIIGEAGLGLSEGQAQRICIARALLRRSPILLLDEATSALDMETERKVLINISNLIPKRTCIVITHRMTVVDICDRVFRLSDNILSEEIIRDKFIANS